MALRSGRTQTEIVTGQPAPLLCYELAELVVHLERVNGTADSGAAPPAPGGQSREEQKSVLLRAAN